MKGAKRKADEAGIDMPDIEQQPCSTSGTGPFAVYFPSGFDPNGEDAEVAWSAYEHAQRRNHFSLVACTVGLPWTSLQGAQGGRLGLVVMHAPPAM